MIIPLQLNCFESGLLLSDSEHNAADYWINYRPNAAISDALQTVALKSCT